MKRFLFAFLILALAQAARSEMNCPKSLPADICQFEEKVYTGVDFKKTEDVRHLLVQFKGLLMSHVQDSALVQEHLLNLGTQVVHEAYVQRAPKKILALSDGKRTLFDMLKPLKQWEAKNGPIVPLDWRLPDGCNIGIASLERSYDVSSDHLSYAIAFFLTLDPGTVVEQFKISQYGGAVIIDKVAGIGSWNEGNMPQPQLPYFSTSSAHQDTPMADGLYLLSVKVKGQKVVEGWFFLHGTPLVNPVVVSPRVNERYSISKPTFHFQDYKSGVLLSPDSRKRSVSISREGDNSQVWRDSVINPGNKNSVTVDQEPNQSGDHELMPGAYRFKLAFEERDYFGDIAIGNLASTIVPFRVTK